ncbi:MAG: hypothetical protein QXE75_04810 [Sulfolobales archaeon]
MGVKTRNSDIAVIAEFISNEWRGSIRLPKKRKMRLMVAITGPGDPPIAVIARSPRRENHTLLLLYYRYIDIIGIWEY